MVCKTRRKTKTKNAEYLKHPQGSIYELGYGQISKLVMLDKDLTIEAKAIYAYICSYSGGGNQAFPSVSKICKDLKITTNRFYKHFKLVLEKRYIRKVNGSQDEFGQFSKNTYEIIYTIEQDLPF